MHPTHRLTPLHFPSHRLLARGVVPFQSHLLHPDAASQADSIAGSFTSPRLESAASRDDDELAAAVDGGRGSGAALSAAAAAEVTSSPPSKPLPAARFGTVASPRRTRARTSSTGTHSSLASADSGWEATPTTTPAATAAAQLLHRDSVSSVASGSPNDNAIRRFASFGSLADAAAAALVADDGRAMAGSHFVALASGAARLFSHDLHHNTRHVRAALSRSLECTPSSPMMRSPLPVWSHLLVHQGCHQPEGAPGGSATTPSFAAARRGVPLLPCV